MNQRPPYNKNSNYNTQKTNSNYNSENSIETILKSKDAIKLWVTDNNNKKKVIRKELLDSEALDVAKSLKDLASTQLRRFYAPVVAFKARLNIDNDKLITDSEVMAQVAGMKAASAYAAARKQPEAITRFFTRAANSIQDRDDFLAFARHFEAVVAFHKIFDKNKSN